MALGAPEALEGLGHLEVLLCQFCQHHLPLQGDRLHQVGLAFLELPFHLVDLKRLEILVALSAPGRLSHRVGLLRPTALRFLSRHEVPADLKYLAAPACLGCLFRLFHLQDLVRLLHRGAL